MEERRIYLEAALEAFSRAWGRGLQHSGGVCVSRGFGYPGRCDQGAQHTGPQLQLCQQSLDSPQAISLIIMYPPLLTLASSLAFLLGVMPCLRVLKGAANARRSQHVRKKWRMRSVQSGQPGDI